MKLLLILGALNGALAVLLGAFGIGDQPAHVIALGGGQYADLSALFCAAGVCPVVVGNDLVFRDDNHLTVSYSRTLAPVLGMIAEQAIAPRS